MQNTPPLSTIRRINILHLIKYYDLERMELAEKLGISYTQLNGYLRPTTPKGIGHKTIKRFEQAFNLSEGELNSDIQSKYPLSNHQRKNLLQHIPTSNNDFTNTIINQEILVVPLFLSNIDNGEFNPLKEPCMDKTFIKVATVIEMGIDPCQVKAIQVINYESDAKKHIYFLDSSVTNIHPSFEWHYAVAINGKREIVKANANDINTYQSILGRAFYVEHALSN